MAIVTELIDEWRGLANQRAPWEAYWREISRYVLPHTSTFDMLLSTSADTAINSVVATPAAAKQSKDLYDMTSLWAVERLTAGIISLKTPESQQWHDMGTDSFFGEEPTFDERVSLDRLRGYLFKVRSNPNSGFWGAHRAAVKSMCAFGDGWMYVEEVPGTSARLPYRYTYLPITELFPGMDSAGVPDRMFRIFRLSAVQAVTRFGEDNIPASIKRMADDPRQKHRTVRVMHAVRPRNEGHRRLGVRGADFASFYLFPDEEHLIGESGFFEFPFTRYAWSNSGSSPFSEGPVAYALGEIKSLQEMSKNELIAIQTLVRPAYATAGKNHTRINLNPGAVNPNLVNGDGRPLFSPMNSGVRPDFAQSIIEARRNNIRELTYLNLWQILLQDKTDTATEALIRAQEKGELLGPVGLSLNEGLSKMVDREVGILGRKRAFDDDSPLAMPDTLANENVAPIFNSPLDRLRRMGELIGMTRLVEFAMLLAGGDAQRAASIMARFDVDEMLDKAQEILGAPVSVLTSRDQAEGERQQQTNTMQAMQAMEALRGGGEAAQSAGAGMQQLAQGAEMAQSAPALQSLLQRLPQAGAAAGLGGAAAMQAQGQ